jgi:DNA primase
MAKNLKEVLSENEIELTESSGDRWVAVCPFHKGDRDPSFTVYPTGTYYCFGCEEWGDTVKFLVDYKHMTSAQALEYVGEDYKFPRADKAKVIKIKNVTKMWQFLYSVVEEYHDFLSKTPGAINYLVKRGLTHATIEKYKLGYTDGHVLNLYWAWEREMAFEAGLINRSGYETMSHRVIIPNLLDSGQGCDFLIGRTVVNDPVKYLGIRVPKPIIGFHSVRNSPIIFVVEGQFDWLLLSQWGYPSVSLGGHHLPKYMRALFANKFLVIVPDYDENNVGQKAAHSLQQTFGENATILDYSRYRQVGQSLDIGELALQENGERKFYEVVMESIWNTRFSKRQLSRWLPNSIDTTSSLLI